MLPNKKRRIDAKTGARFEDYMKRRSPEPSKWRYSHEIAEMIQNGGVRNPEVLRILDKLKDRPRELKNVMMWMLPSSRMELERRLEEMRRKKR